MQKLEDYLVVEMYLTPMKARQIAQFIEKRESKLTKLIQEMLPYLHNPFMHDILKDEASCKECRLVKKVKLALSNINGKGE